MSDRDGGAQEAPTVPRLREPSSVMRLTVVTAVGFAVGAALAAFAPWQMSLLISWLVAAISFVAWVWLSVRHFDGRDTQAHATREDNNRVMTNLVLVTVSVVSLLGVGLDLVKASRAGGAGKFALTIVAVGTVAASWTVVHTVFMLRYAHEYYGDPVGGIDFKSGADYTPDYKDFAYVAFTVGMTFQVSDTDIQSRAIRRTVLRHALLAFLFGAVILAVTVNVIAGLLQ
jgi:uncharacterized membrane protein